MILSLPDGPEFSGRITGAVGRRQPRVKPVSDAHHFIDKGLVAGVEGNKVRLSANANVAVTMEEEK